MEKRAYAIKDTPPHDLPAISPVRISSYSLYDDDFDDVGEPPEGPTSLYSNLTVLQVAKAAWQDKGIWRGDNEPGPASSSGTFGRLLKTTVHRKPDKVILGRPQPHGVTLNLHQFHTDNGDSLGEDPDSWARLKF
jgi:hypothetical protein